MDSFPNSSKTGHKPTNCNGSKSKSTKAKVWSSGASYSLTSNTDLTLWIRAFLVRYYEHLAVAEEHEQNILVYWQNAKGQEPIEKYGLLTLIILKIRSLPNGFFLKKKTIQSLHYFEKF